MWRKLVAGVALGWRIQAQNASFPLESITLEGTRLGREFVMEIAGLRIGAPVDKAVIDAACAKVPESGIFSSITYRYAPGPKHGYALTLMVPGGSHD